MPEPTEAMPQHDRMKIPRQEMPTQEAEVRAHNFGEVALGYQAQMAALEANRCLQWQTPQVALKAVRWG